jgi:hypothetical protein
VTVQDDNTFESGAESLDEAGLSCQNCILKPATSAVSSF